MSENERMEIEQDEIVAHEASNHGPPAGPWDTEPDSEPEDEYIARGSDDEAEDDVDLGVSLDEDGDELPLPAHNIGKNQVAGPTLDSLQMPEDDLMS